MELAEESFQFDGEGDYVEHRSQKSIFDMKDSARRALVDEGLEDVGPQQYLHLVRRRVKGYISELEHVMRQAGAVSLLREEQIHVVEVRPPEDLLELCRSDKHDVLSDRPQPKVAENGHIQGLEGYLTAPDMFSAEWTIRVDKRHEGPQPVTASATTPMPLAASWDAFRKANRFLQQSGLGLEAEYEDYDGGDTPGL